MPHTHIVREIQTPRSFRVSSVAGMFDVPLEEKVRHEWTVSLPITERPWQIGLIVGPSGCGKSTIARELWPDRYVASYEWDERSILDNFPPSLESKQVVAALTSVGFSSPPDWVKPYHVLSTGQQMRSNLARALQSDGLVVFDEFTSVVDRTVAKIGSAALAKSIRKQPGRQFIAVTCHEDVLEWLTPDWTYEPHTQSFQWRSLRRPEITLDLFRVHPKAWALFKAHHYLSATLNRSAICYLAEWDGKPIAFVAILPMMGFPNTVRASRSVVLPDYQGVGIGNALMNAMGQFYLDQGKRFRATTSHPSYIAHRRHDPAWKFVAVMPAGSRRHGMDRRDGVTTKTSTGRSVVSFEYVGLPKREEGEEAIHARA